MTSVVHEVSPQQVWSAERSATALRSVTAAVLVGAVVIPAVHLTIAFAFAPLARGALLGRRIRSHTLTGGLTLLASGVLLALFRHAAPGDLLAFVGGGVVASAHRPPPGTDAERIRVRRLIGCSHGDALAPFAARLDKSYVFSPSGASAISYRVQFGIAAASGDPVGDPRDRPAAIDAFVRHAKDNGWRPAVLGAGPECATWWRRHRMHGPRIGRDVVIDVDRFELVGRRFRNLRQAIRRADNGGLTVEITRFGALADSTRAELEAVVQASKKAADRGFAMTMDGLLTADHPDSVIVIGRGPDDRVLAFHRYCPAGSGTDLSLDVPWRVRRPGIGGIDERLTAAAVGWAREHGAQRVSLAFAAFPGLFAEHTGVRRGIAYRTVRLLDPLIRLESLDRFLGKFHALGPSRSVLLRRTAVIETLAALLWLEFSGK